MSSITPDSFFDLESHFLPAWAKQSSDVNKYADYQGEPERKGGRFRDRPDRRDRRDQPPRRRDQPPGPGAGPGAGPRKPFAGRDSRPRDDRRRPSDRPKAPPVPLPDIDIAFVPDDKGVESLARQIKMTGRAYPLFDIAHMVLSKPERHSVTMSVCKKPDGSVIAPLYLCALDDTLWLSEDAAARHLLERHFTTFYQPERTAVEPPKGTYTFVAQCGISGDILGPPNHHDYQNQLRKLHAERFSRMPFDGFKSRVKIVRDEAVVKKWIDDQSWKTKYVCLNMPEPLVLDTLEEVHQHFRETHLANLVQSVETHRLSGAASRNIREMELRHTVRQAWEDQRRFPIQVATVLSQQFAASGLQFFKVKKTVTHVAVARPHYLDLETTPVSESIRQIVSYIDEHPKCSHAKLLDDLAPMPQAEENAEPTPERTAIIADLHWLVHQGHVIEFANGIMETAKKPLVKPPKPAPAAPTEAAKPAAPASETATASPEATAEKVSAEPAEPSDASASPEFKSAPESETAPQRTEGPATSDSTPVAPTPAPEASAPPNESPELEKRSEPGTSDSTPVEAALESVTTEPGQTQSAPVNPAPEAAQPVEKEPPATAAPVSDAPMPAEKADSPIVPDDSAPEKTPDSKS